MALFDRRLLAYFDDGLGEGNSLTLLDRITDYQRDLAEIERELSKYQLLLGDRQVQFRHRDRDGWIAKNREQKTIKERYRRLALGIDEEAYHERTDARVTPDDASSFSDRRRGSRRAAESGPRGSTKRQSQTHLSLAAPVATGELRVVWVQIDTIFDPPHPRAQLYLVRANWQNAPGKGEETEAVPSTRMDDGEDRIYVRQQLNLKGYPTTSVVTIALYAKQDGEETLLGDVALDSGDSYNHEVKKYALHDKSGRALTSLRRDEQGRSMPSMVRLRLSSPDVSKHRDGTGARASPRFSTFPVSSAEPGHLSGEAERSAAKQHSMVAKDQHVRRSSAASSKTDASGRQDMARRGSSGSLKADRSSAAAEERDRRGSSGSAAATVVTQDPAAAGSRGHERRPSTSLGSDSAQQHASTSASGVPTSAKIAAGAVAGATVATGAAAAFGAVATNASPDSPGAASIDHSFEASPSRASETPLETPMTLGTSAEPDDMEEFEEGEEESAEGTEEEFFEEEEGEEEEGMERDEVRD